MNTPIPKSKKNFVDPAEFFHELLVSMKQDQMTERLGEIFLLIAEKYANHPWFVKYTHIREDLISVGVLACCKAFPKFRPDQNILGRDENGEVIRDEEGEIVSSTPVEWDGKVVPYDYKIHYNPLSLFTTVMKNAFRQFLSSHEYKHRNIVNKYRMEIGLDADEAYADMIRTQEENERIVIAEDDKEAEAFDFEDEEDYDEEIEEKENVIIW